MSKASKEADAIKKLDKSALIAQDRIQAAAEKAQTMIDEACATATQALELSSRIPDKRNINGSFQWDRGDRYRRGSDDRLQRLEDKIDDIEKARGTLDVGAAQRVEQIAGLRAECAGLHAELETKKLEIEHLATELVSGIKEISSRLSTQRDLYMGVKEELDDKIDNLKDEMRQDKIRNQQYVIGIVVGLIVTFLSSVVFGYLRL